MIPSIFFFFFFFFNDTATTEIYTLSLHDALPISECAVDVPIADRGRRGSGTERPVPSRRCLAGEGELLRAIGHHPEEAVARAAARRLAVLGVAGDAQPADAARVIRIEHSNRGPGTQVLALVARRPVVILAVHDRDLEVHLVGPPLAVDARAEIGRRHVTLLAAGGGHEAALQRHLPLHAVVPQRLFPIHPRRVDQADLVG